MYTIPNHTGNNSLAKLLYLSHFRVDRCCLCVYCGVALFEWKETDMGFIEHAKFFLYCPYIRYVKGHVFTRGHRPEYRTQMD